MLTPLAHWVLSSLAILLTSYIVPGFVVRGFLSALYASLIVGLLNIFIWPLLAFLTLPLTLLTFGFFLFVINAIILKIGAALTPGFAIEGFKPALIGGLVMMIIGWATHYLFSKTPPHFF